MPFDVNDAARVEQSGHPLRVCLLTGGGDAPGLNAAVRAFVHAASRKSVLVYASRYGFEGLLGREEVAPLQLQDVRGILPRGGSVLGCSIRSNPFDLTVESKTTTEVIAPLIKRLKELAIDALVIAGGDGTMSIGSRLTKLGIPCIGIPKTIDGDLGGTEQTCGIDTAVETATRAIDALHSTAEAHQRVLVVEVMGRYAGWIAIRSGMAGGADIVLVPEIPYDIHRVVTKIRQRDEYGMRFSLVVIGEGARPIAGSGSVVEAAHPGSPARLGGAGDRLKDELTKLKLPHDIRVTVLGHLQRGGIPTAADRLLATRFGAHAAELCAERRFGRMVTLRAGRVESMPIEEACNAPSRLEPHGELVRCAQMLGVELGVAAAN